jgi:flavin reductase (DIM6/NTAB) family NADH-FMN oxidoreductase RutF
MEKTPVDLAVAYRLLNPGGVVLVTVGDGERDNLFPVAWNMPVSDDPPVVAVLSSKEHFSYPFIERTGELGLSVPDASLVDAVYGCGKTTGKVEQDKFARFGLTRRKAEHIRAPLVEEAVANLECRVSRIVDVEGCGLVIAQVVHAVADPAHFQDGRFVFDAGLSLIHHLSGDRFCVSERIITAQKP